MSTAGAPAPKRWGPFEILEKVGQGAFGEVYRAFDTTLEREVALKLLLPRGMDRESEARALLREARAIARVRHNNVVPIHGVDRHDGRVGFWSDFVRGKTLSALLAAQGPFGPEEAAHIGVDLCRAVAAVHAAGLLHRDIKTANAMREEGGRILLMDFGLTQDHGQHDVMSGTPAYMAPELLSGQPATVGSDIYALGVVLFHLLTGKFPFEASRLSEMRLRHESGPRASVLDLRPDLPEALARVVETAANPDPAKRYSSAGQMISALTDAMGFGQGSVELPLPPHPRRRWFRAWMLAPVAALALFLAVPRTRHALIRTESPAVASARQDYLRARGLVEHYYRPQALETAIPLLQRATGQDPRYAPAWADLGRANFLQFWQLRDTAYVEPARAASLQALALNPELASAHVTLGMLYTETGQNDLAAEELSEAMRIDSRNAEVYSALAELYYRQGRTGEVESTFRNSIELDPGNWRLANEFGYYYLRAGRFDAAAVQYQKAVSLTPDNARALNNLGIAYWRLNQLPAARASLEQAIRIEPSANPFYNLGRVLEEEGKFAEAAEAFRNAIGQDGSHYPAWGQLGEMYSRLGEDPSKIREAYLKAISLAEELRKQQKSQPSLLADLGLYYAIIGKQPESVALLRQAAALAPESPSILHMAAAGFELLHHREEALQFLGRAIAKGRPVAFLERDSALSALRGDPRYKAIINNVPRTSH
ncbi:MAG: protein kinase [Bryobacteraceae bacterium]